MQKLNERKNMPFYSIALSSFADVSISYPRRRPLLRQSRLLTPQKVIPWMYQRRTLLRLEAVGKVKGRCDMPDGQLSGNLYLSFPSNDREEWVMVPPTPLLFPSFLPSLPHALSLFVPSSPPSLYLPPSLSLPPIPPSLSPLNICFSMQKKVNDLKSSEQPELDTSAVEGDDSAKLSDQPSNQSDSATKPSHQSNNGAKPSDQSNNGAKPSDQSNNGVKPSDQLHNGVEPDNKETSDDRVWRGLTGSGTENVTASDDGMTENVTASNSAIDAEVADCDVTLPRAGCDPELPSTTKQPADADSKDSKAANEEAAVEEDLITRPDDMESFTLVCQSVEALRELCTKFEGRRGTEGNLHTYWGWSWTYFHMKPCSSGAKHF